MSFNPGAFFAQHHKAVLVAGGAGAVGLGLLHHKSTAAAASSTTGAAVTPTGTAGQAGTYDSSANDVYNALQPQIEQTQSMLQKLLNALPGTKPSTGGTKPKPKPKPKKKPPVKRPPKKPVTHKPHKPHKPVHKLGPKSHPSTAPKPPVVRKPPRKVAPPAPHAATPTRVVLARRGESLGGVAQRAGVSPVALQRANRTTLGFNGNTVKPGQKVVLPRDKR